MKLRDSLSQIQVQPGQTAIFYLAQAGFCFKTASGLLIYMDAYLSNCCEREFNFRRLIQPVIGPDELEADISVATHAHYDHLDIDALPIVAENPSTIFIGSPDCRDFYIRAGLSEERFKIISEGQRVEVKGVEFRAVYADHGELAPQAVGILMTIDDMNIYNTGDTGYQPERIMQSLATEVDVMIAPINGAYGNLDHVQACRLAELIKPRLMIASHFGMFAEHGGNPDAFVQEAEKLPPGIKAVVMTPGQCMVYSAKD